MAFVGLFSKAKKDNLQKQIMFCLRDNTFWLYVEEPNYEPSFS